MPTPATNGAATEAKSTVAEALSKAPQATLMFWLVKICATTVGETGGDAVTMSMNLGYGLGTLLFAAAFAVFAAAQMRARRFHPWLYWLTIVATTTVGTTMADFADRSLGIGYAGGSALLAGLLALSLLVWRLSEGAISADNVTTPRAETFYWLTILFSQTLGTALGDWVADSNGLGYSGGALLFGALLAGLAVADYATNVSRVALFWAAFILTRPLGATLGDWLDKPEAFGGLAISRYMASGVFVVAMVALIVLLPQRAGRHPVGKATA